MNEQARGQLLHIALQELSRVDHSHKVAREALNKSQAHMAIEKVIILSDKVDIAIKRAQHYGASTQEILDAAPYLLPYRREELSSTCDYWFRH